jgi:exodeoxyribonuclease VII small subunit
MVKMEEKIDFESKIKNAKELLEKLLEQDITLSNSIEIYNQGMKELESARKLLEDAKLQYEEIANK